MRKQWSAFILLTQLNVHSAAVITRGLHIDATFQPRCLLETIECRRHPCWSRFYLQKICPFTVLWLILLFHSLRTISQPIPRPQRFFCSYFLVSRFYSWTCVSRDIRYYYYLLLYLWCLLLCPSLIFLLFLSIYRFSSHIFYP